MVKRFLFERKEIKMTLVAVMVLLVSCGDNQQAQYEQPATDVDFIKIQPATVYLEKKYPGAIEGLVNVDIKSQVVGYLESIYVKEGEYVQQGQSLFRIKDDVYHEQVQNSQATLKAALAAEETARIEVEKIKPLVAGKVVTELQLQSAEASYASAKAQVAQAQASLASSKINAGFTLIKAPVSGYIGRIPNRIGNLITPSDVIPLTTLSEINQVYVYFSLSEADYISFMKDTKANEGINTVELVMADGSPYNHTGKLEAASGNIDRTTGSMALKAVFANPDRILRSGGSAKIILKKTLDSALTVPMASVRDIQDKYFVFALADSNKVAMKPIEIAGNSGNNYVLKSGLKVGEKIALNRIDVLNEGMPVIPGTAKSTTEKEK